MEPMEPLEIKDSCRICLEQGSLVDWNEEIIDSCSTTYKNCYFKYTQLEEDEEDAFSQLLCETCSHDLKNFHFLIEKALESHDILQQTFAATLSQPNEIDDKLDQEDPIEEDGEFEIINFENSKESFKDNDNDIKDFLQVSMEEETLKMSKEIKKKQVNKKTKTKKIISKRVAQDLKRQRDNKKTKKLKNHNDFPEDVEEAIDIPNSEDGEKNSNNPESSTLHYKPTPPKTRKMMCPYCPRLISEQSMKRHEKTHKEYRERSLVCTICGLKFYSDSCLHTHKATHKENRVRYKCEFCNKSYYHRGTLNIHRRIHEGQMVSCPICQKEFFRQVDLDRHKARTHSGNVQDKNFNKHKYYVECKECGKSIYSDRYRHHAALHANVFQMKCTLCDKHFASKVSCHRHVRKVHKYKDEFAKVVDYYGEDLNVRYTTLMLKQTEIVRPVEELE